MLYIASRESTLGENSTTASDLREKKKTVYRAV